MFSLAKASAVVLALTSFAQATITIGAINFKGNSTNTITWTSSDVTNDPETFSIELINESFHSQFALANNVQTTSNSITFEMPVVAPGPNYSLEFVNTGNISDIFSSAGPFSIAENDVSSTASGTKGASTVSSATIPIATATPTTLSASTGGPVTVSSVSSAVGVSSAASGSSSAPTASSSTFSSSGASELIPSGSFAALVAGVIALLF